MHVLGPLANCHWSELTRDTAGWRLRPTTPARRDRHPVAGRRRHGSRMRRPSTPMPRRRQSVREQRIPSEHDHASSAP
jgi:hypothetical protein